MEPVRVLFVDDEPGICLLMSEILQRHGFSVRAVGTVADALAEITSAQFDVLISDLNIGHPGDGFTVVSAMRRTHPKCVTLILTGYPAFETALEAIRHQVDDYLIKPAHIPTLVSLIEQKLQNRKPGAVAATKRIAQILRDNSFEITQQALKEMKSDPLLGKLPITDEERIEHTPQVLEELATMLESAEPDRTPPSTMHASQLRGIRQHQLGYTIPLLATHVRLVERAIYDVIHENLKSLNLSYFMFDMKRLNDSLGLQLEHSLKAFLDAEYPAGLDARSRSGRTQQPLGEARVLKHPVAFAVFTGVVVEVTSLGAGLLLMRAHGNGWPWWFHGIVIASITGFMAGLITWLYTREMRHHDITRSKLAEESLRNSEKLAVAGRMAATVAHEINNPLEAVTDALYLLAESPSLDNSARQFLTIAQDELAKIRQIAILTLGLYRGDAERPQQVKVPELIDNVLSLYGRKLLRTLGVSIETRYDTDVTVNAFPGELQQVFSNLIVNAADAFEKSGGKLFIHVSESLDWTNLTQRGLRITISDNGCGIPVEKRAHIFEPFFTTKGSKGTGIGLWVSHGIVRKYGGTMRFRSVVKQGRSGTTFSIFLPVTQLA